MEGGSRGGALPREGGNKGGAPPTDGGGSRGGAPPRGGGIRGGAPPTEGGGSKGPAPPREGGGSRGARDINLNIPAPEREEAEEAPNPASNPVPNRWTIRKKLSNTDANPDRCEIILPIRQVKEHLLPYLLQHKLDILQSGRPILINVVNDDIMKAYRIKLAFKKSSTSYMLQETRVLVTEGNFVAGKEIKFRWTRVNQEEEGELHFTLLP